MDAGLKLGTPQNIGIIGTGQMGKGIALACLLSGYTVNLYDKDTGALGKCIEKIKASLEKFLNQEKISKGHFQKASTLFRAQNSYDFLRQMDIVIEAVPEDYLIKEELFKEINPFLKNDTILVSNTSSLSINTLAKTVLFAEQFVGLHFMNPAELMQLVEIIPSSKTSKITLEKIRLFVQTLGKESVYSKDKPGFIINRLLILLINEAIFLLMEETASPDDIDKAMKLGANFPMGPLALADMIGLDTCLSILQTFERELDSIKYKPCPLLKEYVQQGKLGIKSKCGFYQYS
ncbi:MAG: 3-hydroxybutyryl-CoA dehydrogenase [Alphaproteobacteria bacterium]|nr:3-hydroxybutyryl-CoA dehydrogenase [Alphaproteobacteria bacterium]